MYRRAVLAAAATALALLGLPTTGTAETVSSPKHYVALGDSYASGPGIPEQRTDPRLGPNPPQFDALRRHTDLVTITIGGNDIDIGALWLTCARLGPTDPSGDPCKRQATAGGTDLCAQRIAGAAPKVARVLAGVRARSPHATVLLVGYLRILPPTTGCYPAFPIARGDVPYVDGVERQLTAMLADQANNHGAVFVDSYAGSLGHDACQQPGVKWVEGPAPTSAAAPDHPNVIGMREVAGFALDPLRDRNGG